MKKFLFLFFFSIFTLTTTLIYANEEDVPWDAIIRLSQIYYGQLNSLPGLYGDFYPFISGYNAQYPCPNNICWGKGKLSSVNAPGHSNYEIIYALTGNGPGECPSDLEVDVTQYGLNGDVRFTCRRQGPGGRDNVWCFAYRCEQSSPAGCKQLWRLRFKVKSDGSPSPLECFDVSNSGICSFLDGWEIEQDGPCY